MFNNGGSKINSDDAKSTVIELFPWVSEFKKMCKCIYADKSMASLAELMQYYIRNVSISVKECYTKPLKAAKLKDSISETLFLFLYIYRELSEDHNRSLYLNNMSNLLALYIDMELKASRKSKEDHSRICTRLISCLYTYLEHSTEHLLDTLIKIQFMCQGYHCILDPIMKKVISKIPAHPESNIMYIRYLLIYYLWRKVNSDMAVKSQITTTAIASLGAPAAFLLCVLEEELPEVPKYQPNPARYLMQQKFDIRKCCELFIQFCRETRESIWQKKSENATTSPNSPRRTTSQLLEVASRENENMDCIKNKSNLTFMDKNTQNDSVSLNNLKSSNLTEQTNVKPFGTISTNISVARTIFKQIKPKVLPRKKTKKSKKIVIIDLTTDIAFERCIKKRKSRKIAWLEEAKRKLDAKAIRASQKKQQMVENVTSLKKMALDQQLEDFLQSIQATENTCLKNNLNASATWDMKLEDNDKMKSMQYFETECRSTSINSNTISTKQSMNVNSSDKSKIVGIPRTVSSVIVDRPQSNKSKASTKLLLDVTNDTNNISKYHDVNTSLETVSVQTSVVQEHDRTKSEAVISKLYDDQILRKIEQRVSIQNNTLEKLDVQRELDKLFKKDMENKFPLKKRLKAHAMMSMMYEKVPIKAEKLDNYPGIPMMSIAALEALDSIQKNLHSTQIIKSSYELSPDEEEDNPHGSYHFNSNIVRRSLKRHVPKINYYYTDIDPEWNPSGESKRRRSKED
ncbi:unnamed protein product [Lasius platythorax]|uniref:Uncharacterized protein n=1 Tax=Lasius platythorax TaxID=488582 RepID=A0AAV2NJI4_9HYME